MQTNLAKKLQDKIHLLDPALIADENRARSDFGSINELKENIRVIGQLQPIRVERKKYEHRDYKLVAGGRRLRACRELKIEIRAMIVDELTELEYLLLEFSENDHRKDLSPAEAARSIQRLHKGLCAEHKDKAKQWSARDTATFIGKSHTFVSDKLATAAMLMQEKADFEKRGLNVNKLTEKQLRGATRRSARLRRLIEKIPAELAKVESKKMQERVFILEGDTYSEKVEAQLPMGTFDLILTDPSWGIDYQISSKSQVAGKLSGTHYEDTWQDAFTNVQPMFEFFARALNPKGGKLCCFCATETFAAWQLIARQIGFRVYSKPIIWTKGMAGSQPMPQFWPSSCYESLLFAHWGKDSELARQGLPDHFPCPPVASNLMRGPSEKPTPMWTYLLQMCVFPGTKVLDPFMGVGNSLRAAFDYQCLEVWGIDINPEACKVAWTNFTGEFSDQGENHVP